MTKPKLGNQLSCLPDAVLYAISEEVYEALEWECNKNFIPDDWKYEDKCWAIKWDEIRPVYAPNEDVLNDFFNIEVYTVGVHYEDCRGGIAPALYSAFASNDFNLTHKAFILNTLDDDINFKSFPTFKDLLKHQFYPLKTTMWEVMVNFLNGDTHPFDSVDEFEKWIDTVVYHHNHDKKERAERQRMGWFSFYDWYTRHYWLRWGKILNREE